MTGLVALRAELRRDGSPIIAHGHHPCGRRADARRVPARQRPHGRPPAVAPRAGPPGHRGRPCPAAWSCPSSATRTGAPWASSTTPPPRVVERARAGKLGPDELSGSTFTISNMGMFGVEQFTAIINPGESGILAVSSILPTAVAVGDGLAVRQVMRLTLSADHRLVDGELGRTVPQRRPAAPGGCRASGGTSRRSRSASCTGRASPAGGARGLAADRSRRSRRRRASAAVDRGDVGHAAQRPALMPT